MGSNYSPHPGTRRKAKGSSHSSCCLLQVSDQVCSVLRLLQASKHHLGTCNPIREGSAQLTLQATRRCTASLIVCMYHVLEESNRKRCSQKSTSPQRHVHPQMTNSSTLFQDHLFLIVVLTQKHRSPRRGQEMSSAPDNFLLPCSCR